MKRPVFALRTLALLVLAGIAGQASPAAALGVPLDPTTMFVLPMGATTPVAPTAELESGTVFRLFDDALADDYDATVTATKITTDSLNAASETNALKYEVDIQFTWNGTVDSAAPAPGLAPYLLLSVIQIRWGTDFVNSEQILAGLNNFAGDTVGNPFLVTDTDNDFFLSGFADRWVGVALPLMDGVPVSLTFDRYIAQDVTAITGLPSGQKDFLNVIVPFVGFEPFPPVPEPGPTSLAVLSLAALVLLRRRGRA